MLKLDDIKKYDHSDMFSKIANFHEQIKDAVSIGENFRNRFISPINRKRILN